MLASVLLRILAVLLLVAANAFFVAAEFALVSIRSARIQQLIEAHRIGARTVQKLHSSLSDLLNAVQLGVTLTSLALGWIGEPVLAALFQVWIGHVPYARVYAHGLAIVTSFCLITYLLVILGEVVPKSLALQRSERVALAVAAPMDFFMTATRPFLRLMTRSSQMVLSLFGIEKIREGGVHSTEELKQIVTASRRFGMMPAFQEDLILRALELGNISVREVMVPRPRIFSLPADLSLADAMSRVVEEQHSRVPVYDPIRGPEHIIGLLYSKDISRWMRLRLMYPDGESAMRLERMQVRNIMRDVLVVPETKLLPDLLLEFKQSKRHLAVVVDEFGSTAGLITVEDVLEQLVGEIEDEFDIALQPLAPGASTMVLDGSVNIRDLDTLYHVVLPRDQGFETLAGFILAELQRLPRVGDVVKYAGRRFTVMEMEGRRIARVKIEAAEQQAVTGQETGARK